ncbi:MAG: acyl carrier protein [Cyanothece sp. SIO2G6]|nr:acyl carrier protein [Cyanothece sp. SIO2G6]
MVSSASELSTAPTQQVVEQWLVDYLSSLLDIDVDEIDVAVPFDRYGLDSSAALALTGDLGTWLKRDLEPTVIYDYPTIEALAKFVC